MFSSNIIVYNLLRTRSSFAKISKSWAIWLYKYFWNVVILVIIHLLILCYIKILFSEIWKTQGLNKVVPKILRIFNFDHKSITWSFLLSCFLPSNFQDISHSFFFHINTKIQFQAIILRSKFKTLLQKLIAMIIITWLPSIKLTIVSSSLLKTPLIHYGDKMKELFTSMFSLIFFHALLLIFVFHFGVGQWSVSII